MKEKFLNIFTIIFLVIFSFTLFKIVNSNNKFSKNFAKNIEENFDKEFSGTAKVIDGDSIKVDKNEVRLFEIDAPEYSQNCFDKNKKEYECGKISSKFLKNLADDKKVRCIYSQKDIYNRFLAKCFIDNLSINEEIIKNGMAIIYDYNTSNQKMIDLELSAKNSKIGIWQGAFQIPKEYRKSKK